MRKPGPDRLLFTPGPLTTSRAVKEAMLVDLGSRDQRFISVVQAVRHKLLALADVAEPSFAAILLQGSGTYAVEAVLGSVVPRSGRLLALINGAYGARIAELAEALGIETVRLRLDEGIALDPARVEAALDADEAITHVSLVHCETSTGLVNPIEAIGEIVAARGRAYLVDAMSSLGGIPLSMSAANIDYLVSSANKCIQGVPGFAFALVRRQRFAACRGVVRSTSTSLDLHAQLEELDRSGQFRYTPPTHAILACDRALDELLEEGGVEGRAARYQENHRILLAGMSRLGFRPLLPRELQGPIITSFHCPADPRFEFGRFYERLAERGCLIYPGKTTGQETFRIGTIGALDTSHVQVLLAAIAAVLEELGVATPLP